MKAAQEKILRACSRHRVIPPATGLN
jgi:hypothetical protein